MANIAEIFSQKNVISYLQQRVYPNMLGDTLFPSRKVPNFNVEILENTRSTPVIAPVSTFDVEAEIGSREANVTAAELGYIKRKMQLKEEDIMALRSPRNAEEETYLTQNVYNDIDNLVRGIKARVELMRMQLLAQGVVYPDDENVNWKVDYKLPKEHQLTVSKSWDKDGDPIADIQNWISGLDTIPTRALTSNKVVAALLKNGTIADYFKRLGLIPSPTALNQLFQGMGLPTIVTYDQKYRFQGTNGQMTVKRYFPEDKFIMFDDATTGETLYGPTPEESRILAGNAQLQNIGNIVAMVYETNLDPISTWTKAAATALPTLASRDTLFQAKVLLDDTNSNNSNNNSTSPQTKSATPDNLNNMTVQDIKALLDKNGVTYDPNDKKDDLINKATAAGLANV